MNFGTTNLYGKVGKIKTSISYVKSSNKINDRHHQVKFLKAISIFLVNREQGID